MKMKKMLSWLLVLVLCIGVLPMTALAASIDATSFEPPIISNLEIVPIDSQTSAYVSFELENPSSVWDAYAYFTENIDPYGTFNFDAQVNVDNSGWENIYVSGGIDDGIHIRESSSDPLLTPDSFVQFRIRYAVYYDADYHYSDWSNILSVNAPDWEASEWATEELQQAAELGLIPDILQGADLTQSITRAEFAAVSVKAYEALSGTAAIPAVNNPFADTADIEVLKAYNTGITSGVSATEFDPAALLNREQAATMLTRVFKKVSLAGWTLAEDGNFTLPYEKPAMFSDDADISDWAKDSVYFMAANGIISGVGDNKFAPKNITAQDEAAGYANATREQALIIAVRMGENLKK